MHLFSSIRILLLVALLWIANIHFRSLFDQASLFLVFEKPSEEPLAVYWGRENSGFSGEDCSLFDLRQEYSRQLIRVPVPAAIVDIRLDPPSLQPQVHLSTFRYGFTRHFASVPVHPSHLQQLHEIASVSLNPSGKGILLTIPNGATDPSFTIPDWHLLQSTAWIRAQILMTGVHLISLAFLTILLWRKWLCKRS
jgi:hypothetical protein